MLESPFVAPILPNNSPREPRPRLRSPPDVRIIGTSAEASMKLTIPDPSLVLLVGPSGCGKSTFARRHFKPTEVVSSDFFRGLVCDDEGHQGASRDAFELVHEV